MPESQVTIIGTTGHDVSLKFLDSGAAVGKVSVAVNRRWKRRDSQEWQEETSWYDVVLHGKIAENAKASLPKGTNVIVTGRLQQRSWEGQEGKKVSKVEIIAEDIGPSLRWSTATVVRMSNNNHQQAPSNEHAW